MPISQGSAGGLPGMTLKAWALVSAAGVLIKGQGVASAAKTGTGTYMLTFSSGIGTTEYVLDACVSGGDVNNQGFFFTSMKSRTAGSVEYYTYLTGVGLRDSGHYVAIYA